MSLNAITYLQPPTAPAPGPVRFPSFSGEWRIAREALRLAYSAPWLTLGPRGNREPVLLIPGWQAPQASMGPLRRQLRLRGYDARHWGLGTNRGDVEHYLAALLPKVGALSRERGNKVALIGWSLGGVIAREIARELPDQVSCVVTYGSPIIGGPSYTVAAASYGEEECRRINALSLQRAREVPITVPVAAVFSRRDTIVSWPACIDRESPQVVHYEVKSTHLSMGIDPTVWRIALATLARYASAEV